MPQPIRARYDTGADRSPGPAGAGPSSTGPRLPATAPRTMFQYPDTADFWNRTLQNWQSELLAVASMAVLSIYLRQRGSPESKPVGAAHSATGVEGG